MSEDVITIKDLEAHFRVGVPDEERAKPQRLLVTVAMRLDFGPAAATDDLERTIDYYAVSRRLLALGADRSWKLIETLSSDIAELVLREFAPRSVKVEVKKFIIPEARWVSVALERPRQREEAG